MPPKLAIKLSAIVGSYILAGVFALAAMPQFKVQDEETLSGAIESIQEAFKSEGNATIILPAKEQRHPWSGFFAVSSVLFAIAGTGGLVWTLFGKPETSLSISFLPPAVLPPSPEAYSAPSYPSEVQQQWNSTSEPDPVPPVSSKPESSSHQSFQERRQQLFDKLVQSPQSWILQLLEATPLLIWGEQQSGKSQLAQFIALLRAIFIDHNLEANDPQGHINHWSICFSLYGSSFNYAAIDRRIQAYYQRLTQTPPCPTTSIWDDCTHYIQHCPSQKIGDLNFIKSVASESQKKAEFPILISQGRPQTALGESWEIQEMLENHFIQIRLSTQRSATGKAEPAGRGWLKGLINDSQGKPEELEIEIPRWMQASYLLDLFPELERDCARRAMDGKRDFEGFSPPAPSRVSDRATEIATSLSQRLQIIKLFIQLQQQDFNKEQTILHIWNIVKDRSQQWEDASAMYDRMLEEYKDFIESKKSLDELDRWERS
ncbi:hypothetical protein [Lusitaniella coriacea]|uniref:hypothetical protein n=1 Tax=Lusitaniella coriacea TaxID=1983105 RepID=UPI003CF2929A